MQAATQRPKVESTISASGAASAPRSFRCQTGGLTPPRSPWPLLSICRVCLAAALLLALNRSGQAQATSAKNDPNELLLGKPFELLQSVKLPENVIRGTWKRVDEALVCEASPDALVMVPIAIRGSYELDFEFTRRTNEQTVALVFPIGLTSSAIVMSGWAGAASGIAILDGRESKDLPLTTGAVVRPGKLANGQKHHLHLEVIQQPERATITATFNGQRFIAWKGHPAQVSCWPAYTLPCPQSVGVVSYESVVDVHRLELTVRRGGKAYRLWDDFKSPATIVADAPPKAVAANCRELKGHKYYISDKPMDFPAAQRLAAQLQGRLLTISSAEENAFILKEGRGVEIWMSGWRHAGSGVWRDERNRPLRYSSWAPSEPRHSYWETALSIRTTDTSVRGWDDLPPWHSFHTCIEWGEEYPAAK